MNWIIAAAGLASATTLLAHTTLVAQTTQPRPSQQTPGQRVQPQQPGPRATPPGQDRQVEASPEWSEAEVNRPGRHHQILDPVIGEWTALVTVHRDGRQHQSQGILVNQWVLDNRFIRGVYTAEEDGDQRHQGISFIGYNNAADHYEATWLDTTTTQIMHATGHLEPNTQVLTLHGKYNCTMTGNEIPTRIVARMETPDRIIWEMFENPGGEREHKTLEIVYTRRDDGAIEPGMRRPNQMPVQPPQPRNQPR